MSRIGKLPVTVPAGVEVKVSDSNLVTVKGPKGELQEQITNKIVIEVAEGVVNVKAADDSKEARESHGLARTLINNMVVGVTTGYEKKLQMIGVGYELRLLPPRRNAGSGRYHHSGYLSHRNYRSGC